MASLDYTTAEPVLQVQGVSLTLGDKLILRDVNATVCDVIRPGVTQGQVIAFLGPSGRGKTLLSKILAGLRQPTSGSILVNSPPTPVRAGMVGYVTQNYLLRRTRTLKGNLMLAARMHSMNRKEAESKVAEYIETFELAQFANQYPAQLSGGQRQRVAIAQQLLCSDHYLIMDEPFASLDLLMKEKVCDLIAKVSLLDELNTLIIVSHDIQSVLKVADTAWLLGQDRNADGTLTPGSYIKRQYNLMERGLCWQSDISRLPAFSALVSEIESEFRSL